MGADPKINNAFELAWKAHSQAIRNLIYQWFKSKDLPIPMEDLYEKMNNNTEENNVNNIIQLLSPKNKNNNLNNSNNKNDLNNNNKKEIKKKLKIELDKNNNNNNNSKLELNLNLLDDNNNNNNDNDNNNHMTSPINQQNHPLLSPRSGNYFSKLKSQKANNRKSVHGLNVNLSPDLNVDDKNIFQKFSPRLFNGFLF